MSVTRLAPAFMALIANYRAIRHDDTDALQLAQRWSKYMAVTFAVGAGEAMGGIWPFASIAVVLGSAALSCLELFVAFLQAYVFTLLSALFIGAAVHRH